MSASSSPEPVRWRLATRIAFRFVFCFFLLAFFPFPFHVVPGVEGATQKLWELIAIPVGQAVFGVTADPVFNGSGDKTFYWLQYFVIAVASAAAALLWSIADRRRPGYPRLHAWFHVYVRFALAAAMISYGSFKVIPSQFSPPWLDRLMQPFGDASPMGLLWTFMGASMAYTIFTGVGEMAAGLLLAFRRTALLGALITAAVMTHVVVLNFCYDVPVKAYSTQLLLAALVIIAPDAGRLARFFVGSEPATRPVVHARKWRIAATVLAAVVVAVSSVRLLVQSAEQRASRIERFAPTPLTGIWNVDELTVDGVSRPPLTTDLTRWRRFLVSGKEMMSIQNMDDTRVRYRLDFDETKRAFTLKKWVDPKFEARFAFTRIDANTFALDGTFEGKRTIAKVRKAPDREFLLMTRGFHWINESPFNR
jgi:hypothetical protein